MLWRPSLALRACLSPVGNGVAFVASGNRDPGPGIDESTGEADGAVAHEHVAAGACVVAPHLVGMAEGIVGGVDDDFRMIVGVGAAVDADEASGTIVFGGPGAEVEARRRNRSGDDADPGFVAQ